MSATGAVLSGFKIRELLEHEDHHQRLIVSPILEPEEQLRDEQASIDVRLGSLFFLVSPSGFTAIDEYSRRSNSVISKDFHPLYREDYVPIGKGFVIHPHQFVLATTLEYLRLPKNLTASVVGRSTLGRLGLIVATAVGVHPLYAGVLTLELRNLGESPIRLYPGQTIAQLFLQWVDTPASGRSTTGQYTGSVDPIPRTISGRKTKKVIRKFMSSI